MATHRRERNRPLIPQRDERDPYARIIATVHDSVEVTIPDSWPWEETSEAPEYPLAEQAIPTTVEVTFEESTAERRAVTRPPGYWKMRSGKFLAIREMEDSHLLNCILMCERNSQARGRRASGGVYEELRRERQRRNQQREHERAVQQYLQSQTENAQRIYWQMTQSEMGLSRRGLAAIGNPDSANLGQGNAPAGFGGIQTPEAPPPEPLPSHSVIEENRPTRRIKK